MNAEERAATWKRINELLVEHERAESDAIRVVIAESWDKLRQRLTVVALDEPAENGGEPA